MRIRRFAPADPGEHRVRSGLVCAPMWRRIFPVLVAIAALRCVPGGPAARLDESDPPRGPLTVRTDSAVYHLRPDPTQQGAHHLRLLVTLENRGRDTIFLAFPCDFGPRPARSFLRVPRLERGWLGAWGCVAAGPDTHGVAVPPQSAVVDTIPLFIPAFAPKRHEIRWQQYLGAYRVAYSRRIQRRFWPYYWRRYWVTAPLEETMSNVFRVDSAR